MWKALVAAGVAIGLLVVTAAAVGLWVWRHMDGPATIGEVKHVNIAKRHSSPLQVSESTLTRLHEQALQRFYSDPRNGYSRMPVVYEKVVRPWPELWWSPGELEQPTATKPGPDLTEIHAGSVRDFLSPDAIVPKDATAIVWSFPNNKDKPGEKVKNWEAKSVDLVGLLKQETPVVYVSEKIPEMDELKNLPTRPLDLFEALGVESLKKGDELFVRTQDGVVRMIGAVRAKADCLTCHTTKKDGDLLGAFSYTLREAEYRDPRLRNRPAPKAASQNVAP